MILVDDRKGSGELVKYFNGSAELTRLDFADFAFDGNGPNSLPVSIGIERKTIRDLINSMKSGRFSGHQLIGLTNCYNIVYLIVEGFFRPNPRSGQLEIYHYHKWSTVNYMMKDIWCYLNTLTVMAGVHPIMTSNPRETVYLIQSLYSWWNSKEYADHHSHLQSHDVYPKLRFVPHSLIRRVVTQLKGVGWEKAEAISETVDTVEELVALNEGGWQEIPGIGAKLSKSIVAELRGGRA